jgi:oligoribonuclease NrnB/cAMP/cGMP phosphodiesterase (DHH superfamily)
MNFFEEALLSRAREFISCLARPGTPEEGRLPLIAYHGDGDGCTSAYLVHRLLKRPARFYWVETPDFDFEKAETHILMEHPQLLIFLDMPVYNRPHMIQKLTDQGIRVFIYDHHYPGTRPLFDGDRHLLYINPAMEKDSIAYPTCLFASELLEEKTPFEKKVLYMGLYTETWLERVPLFHEFSPELQENLKETAKRIHASFLVQEAGTTHLALNFLFKAQAANSLDTDFRSLRENQVLCNIHDLIQHEKSWLMREVVDSIRKLIQPRYILMRIESKVRVCGLIASELRWKYPHLVVGIWQKWKDRLICELRRGMACRIDLASLIEGAKAGIPLLTGGGHPEAAAFAAEEETFFHALRRIKSQLAEKGEV